jgi:hypothetical protein
MSEFLLGFEAGFDHRLDLGLLLLVGLLILLLVAGLLVGLLILLLVAGLLVGLLILLPVVDLLILLLAVGLLLVGFLWAAEGLLIKSHKRSS